MEEYGCDETLRAGTEEIRAMETRLGKAWAAQQRLAKTRLAKTRRVKTFTEAGRQTC